MEKPFNVLFLCTANSARSIMAEAIINRLGAGRFAGYSAGSHPRGQVNALTIALLQRLGYETGGLRSKSWDEFVAPGAPKLDFVFTVCDSVAAEVCPIWPGQPMTAHWGAPDPAAVTGSEQARNDAFREAYRILNRRIELFVSLPVRSLDRMSLQRELESIGRSERVLQA
jgi:protein-tyrosine-phosphatase